MAKMKVNEIEIDYSIDGEGEPLVLVMGLGYDRWAWHRVIPALAKKYKVISFDNRGVGKTDRTPGPYTAEMMAQDTLGLLDGLGIKKATIAGLSMGGFIVQALYFLRPELFQRLILLSTSFGGGNSVPPSADVIEQLMNPSTDIRERAKLSCAPQFCELDKDFFEYWVQHRTQNPVHPEGYLSQLAVGMNLLKPGKSFEARLNQVKVATCILFGELDRIIPVANGEKLHKAIPNSQLVVFPEVGHFLPIECPQKIVEEISKFMETTAPIMDVR